MHCEVGKLMFGKNIGIGIAIKIRTNTTSRIYKLKLKKNPPIRRRAKKNIEFSQLTV
jgi:hypothetical protein